jgi:hypothetical protein
VTIGQIGGLDSSQVIGEMVEIQRTKGPNLIAFVGSLKLNVEILVGSLIDDDIEDGALNRGVSYLGPVGQESVYVKCGSTYICDVYYSEVIFGKFYVGLLWKTGEKNEFCPFEIHAGKRSQFIYFMSRCEGDQGIRVFRILFEYESSGIVEELELGPLSNKEDLRICGSPFMGMGPYFTLVPFVNFIGRILKIYGRLLI